MNYRHAFHAGNFADVFKHAVLSLIISYLKEKPGAFRILDTHAGSGLYDLDGSEAMRTGEWRDGIARLLAAPPPPPMRDLLSPFLGVIATHNPEGVIRTYPGSPVLARALLSEQDRLIACELHPPSFAALSAALAGDHRVKTVATDGWQALAAYLPPAKRRGLVLVDPPFEAEGEFDRLIGGLAVAHKKWATGITMLWYPVKDRRATESFTRELAALGIAKILRAELFVAHPAASSSLAGCGLLIVNPPWPLRQQLSALLPYLSNALRRAPQSPPPLLQWISGGAE